MNTAPVALLLSISLAAALGRNIIVRNYSRRDGLTNADVHFFNAVSALLSALVLLIWGGFGTISLFTLLCGIAFGLTVGFQNLFFVRALALGPWSYTTVIVSLSSLITTLSGAVFWHESITVVQWIGIACMVGCSVLSVGNRGGTIADCKRSQTVRWLLTSLLAFLLNGLIGLTQKLHQSSTHREELGAFLIVAFGVLFAYSTVLWGVSAFRGGHGSGDLSSAMTPMWLVWLAVGGVLQAVNHKLNLYLSGVMDSAVFFPIVNGGGLVLTTLLAVTLFRERLDGRQWVGLILGIVSVVLVCNPF